MAVEICDTAPVDLTNAFVEADPDPDFVQACMVVLGVDDFEIVLGG